MKFKYLFILLITLFFIGCTDKNEPNDILKLGNTVWPGYEPLYLGQHKKIIDREDVRLVEYTSTTKVLRAYRNNQIDAAAMTLYDVLILLAEGYDPQIILVMDISNGGDVIISQNEYKNLHDLKGKTVGIENSAMGIQVLSRALDKYDMNIDDVIMKRYDGYEHQKAYKEKKIDAIVTYEPMRTQMLNEGSNEIFTSKEMPNEILDVLVVRKKYLDTHTKQIKRLIDNWYKSLKYKNENRIETNNFFAKRLKIQAKEVDGAFEGLILPTRNENIDFFNNKDPYILKVAKNIELLMLNNGFIDKTLDVNNLLDYDISSLYELNSK